MGAIVSSHKFLQRHKSSADKRKNKKRARHLSNGKENHTIHDTSSDEVVKQSSSSSPTSIDRTNLSSAQSGAANLQSSKRQEKRRRNSNYGHNSLRKSKHSNNNTLDRLPHSKNSLVIIPRSSWTNKYRFQLIEFDCNIDDKDTMLIEKNSVLKYKTPHFRATAKVEVPPIPKGKQFVVGWIQVVRSMTFVNLYGDLGITSWEFPEITTGKQKMISDSDGHRYPWYGARKEVVSIRGPKHSPTVVSVSMNDNFSPQVTWHIPAPNSKKAPRDPRLTRVYRQQAFTTCLAVMEVVDNDGHNEGDDEDDAARRSPANGSGEARTSSYDSVFSTTKFTNNNNNIVQAFNYANVQTASTSASTSTMIVSSEGGTSFRALPTTATSSSSSTTTTTQTMTSSATILSQHFNFQHNQQNPSKHPQQHHHQDQQIQRHHNLLSFQTPLPMSTCLSKFSVQQKRLKNICSSEPRLYLDEKNSNTTTTNTTTMTSHSRVNDTKTRHRKQDVIQILRKPFNIFDHNAPHKHHHHDRHLLHPPPHLHHHHSEDFLHDNVARRRQKLDLTAWLENLKPKTKLTKPFASSQKTSNSIRKVNSNHDMTSGSSSSSSSPLKTSSSSPPLKTSSSSSPPLPPPPLPVRSPSPSLTHPPSSPPLQSPSSSPSPLCHVMILKAIDWCMEIEIAVDPNQPIGNRARLINRPSSRFSKPELIEDDARLNNIIDSSALFPPNANRSQVLVWRPFDDVKSQTGSGGGDDDPTVTGSSSGTSSLVTKSENNSSSSSSSSPPLMASSSSSSSPLLSSSVPIFDQCNDKSLRDKHTLLSITQIPQPSSSLSSPSSSLSSPSSSSSSSPLTSASSSSSPPPFIPPSQIIVVKPNQTTVDMSNYFQLSSNIRGTLFESVAL